MNTLSVRLADRADLAIEFATLGGYGLEPITGCDESLVAPARRGPQAPRHTVAADAGCGRRDREIAWEASTPAGRGNCDRPVHLIDAYAGAFCSGS